MVLCGVLFAYILLRAVLGQMDMLPPFDLIQPQVELVLTVGVLLALLAAAKATGLALPLWGRPAAGWGWPVGLVLLALSPFVLLVALLGLMAHDRLHPATAFAVVLNGFAAAAVLTVVFWGATRLAFEQRFGPIGGVLLVALAFGLFHLTNLSSGHPAGAVAMHLVQGCFAGILYASLARRVMVLWPVILVQGLWETVSAFMADAALSGAVLFQLGIPALGRQAEGVLAVFWLTEPALGLLMLLALWRHLLRAKDLPA